MATTLSDLPYTALQGIFSSLADHPGSLASLILVNRSLYLTGIASLYRHVSVNLHTLPFFSDSLTPEKCQHVRTLSVFVELPLARSKTYGPSAEADVPTEGFHRYAPASLSGCVQMLSPKVKQMRRLNTFSFRAWRSITLSSRVWTYCRSLNSSDLTELVSALPETCVRLELDCAVPLGLDGDEHGHHCQAIQQILPRLEHLRLRLSTYCDDLLAVENFLNCEPRGQKLQTLVVHETGQFEEGLRSPACPKGRKRLVEALECSGTFLEHFPALHLFNIVSAGPFDQQRLPATRREDISTYVHGNTGSINMRAIPIRQLVRRSTLLVPFEVDPIFFHKGREHGNGWEFYCRLREGAVLYGNVDKIFALLDQSPWETRERGIRTPTGSGASVSLETKQANDESSGTRASDLCGDPHSYPSRLLRWPDRDESPIVKLDDDEGLTGQVHLRALEVDGLEIESALSDVLPDGWELDPEYYADLADSNTRIRRIEASQWTHAVP